MTASDLPGSPGTSGSPGAAATAGASGDRDVSRATGSGACDGPGADEGSGAADGSGAAERPGAAAGADAAVSGAGGAGRAAGAAALSLDGPLGEESAEEIALRAMMREAVSGLHGSPDALDHLRRAIPARRRRRRQAVVGSAAAVLLVGLAVPALVRVSARDGGAPTAPADVANPQVTVPSTGLTQPFGGPSGQATDVPGNGPSPHPTAVSAGPGRPTVTATATGAVPPAPDCRGAQLKGDAGTSGSTGNGGTVYGWFRVSNLSGSACTVPGPGTVRAVMAGAADQGAVRVVRHTAGDPASGLPSAPYDVPFVLAPGQDYEVSFAWVPDAGGPGGCVAATTPPAATATPTATATGSAGGTGGLTHDGGGASMHGPGSGQSGGSAAGSSTPGDVALSHTPAAGGPTVAGPVIQNVCAGTVYVAGPVLEAASGGPLRSGAGQGTGSGT